MWQQILKVADAIVKYVESDDTRNKRLDNTIGAIIYFGTMAFLVGLVYLAYALLFGGGADIPGGDAGGDGTKSTVSTPAEEAPPTGEAEGSPESVNESTIPFASELPEGESGDGAGDGGSDGSAAAGSRPSVVGPRSGSSLRSLSPELSWAEQSGVTSYYVEIARDPAVDADGYYREPTFFEALVSGGSWRLPAIQRSGAYYWHVGAGERGEYATSFSPSMRIEIISSPAVIAPTGGERVDQEGVRFEWRALDGAVSYQVEVSSAEDSDTQKGFSEFVFRESYIEDTSYKLTRALEPGEYYWHVRGIDEEKSRGAFSGAHRFVVK